MAAAIEIKYFNTFLLKKVTNSAEAIVWGGSLGIPTSVGGYPQQGITPSPSIDWVIEEARIRGGFNNTSTDYGVKAYLVEDNNNPQIRSSSMIYSGVYNPRLGLNNTNNFSVGEDITKSLDPVNGSIQKLYAEDTNLIIFQENKVSRALVDKDAIYSAEGTAIRTSSNVVIGQVQAFAGNYGISKDPESFAVHGYRKYFTDRYRNAVLRLSQDGITEISQYGMIDHFRDDFADIDSAQYGVGFIRGSWDVYNKQYTFTTQRNIDNPDLTYNTISFNEESRGFISFNSYKPTALFSLKSNYYTMVDGGLWRHYDTSVNPCNYYGTQYGSSIEFVFNKDASAIKNFKTVNYEGDNGWQVDSFESGSTGSDLLSETWTRSKDVVGLQDPAVWSYTMGAYDDYGNSYPDILYNPVNRAGFDRKENKYMAVLKNNSDPTAGEINYGQAITGIKGYFAKVKMSTDGVTNISESKELFAASTNIDYSTY